MTFKENFVVEVKVNGKILRVKNDIVYLPFGCEYSIYMKNLNSVRASVSISIDGQDVLDNKKLVIDPNACIDFQGFMKNNQVTNKFKFIQKTKQIQDHRGDKIDDGIIRIEFAFEKQHRPVIIHEHIYHHHDYSPFHWDYNHTYWNSSSAPIYGNVRSYSSSNDVMCNASFNTTEINTPQQDEGITVKGSETTQMFNYTTMGELEAPQVITFQLRGVTNSGIVVHEEVTVKSKLVCSTCGKSNKSSHKYCTNCGTFLE